MSMDSIFREIQASLNEVSVTAANMGSIVTHDAWDPFMGSQLKYRKVFNIRHNKSKNLSDCRLVLQMHLANPLKPGIKLRMKM